MNSIAVIVAALSAANVCNIDALQLIEGARHALEQPTQRGPSADTWANRVVSIAKRFDSAACQTEIAKAGIESWKDVVVPQNLHLMDIGNQVYVNPQFQVAYSRNQKVASTYMERQVPRMFGEEEGAEQHNFTWIYQDYRPMNASVPTLRTTTEQKRLFQQLKVNESLDPYTTYGGHSPVTDDWYMFTIVADPIRTAVSAYLEVSRRLDGLKYPPQYRSIPCNASSGGNRFTRTQRFRMYLRDLKERRRLGVEAFHSYPQALKLNVKRHSSRTQTFDGIGTLEHFREDMKVIQLQALEKLHDRLPYLYKNRPRVRNVTEAELPLHSSTMADDCADINLQEPELVRTLCDVYKVDYTCFGYELPYACRS